MNIDTSHYPVIGSEHNSETDWNEEFSLKTNLEMALSNTLKLDDTSSLRPCNWINCSKQQLGNYWKVHRSKSDRINVRLIADNEECQLNVLNEINSSSFLAKMNSEIIQIKALAEGKVTLKSNTMPMAKFLTGTVSMLELFLKLKRVTSFDISVL